MPLLRASVFRDFDGGDFRQHFTRPAIFGVASCPFFFLLAISFDYHE